MNTLPNDGGTAAAMYALECRKLREELERLRAENERLKERVTEVEEASSSMMRAFNTEQHDAQKQLNDLRSQLLSATTAKTEAEQKLGTLDAQAKEMREALKECQTRLKRSANAGAWHNDPYVWEICNEATGIVPKALSLDAGKSTLEEIARLKGEVEGLQRVYAAITRDLTLAFDLKCLPMQATRFAIEKYNTALAQLAGLQKRVEATPLLVEEMYVVLARQKGSSEWYTQESSSSREDVEHWAARNNTQNEETHDAGCGREFVATKKTTTFQALPPPNAASGEEPLLTPEMKQKIRELAAGSNCTVEEWMRCVVYQHLGLMPTVPPAATEEGTRA